MTEPQDAPLIYKNVDAAPILYFDLVPTHGVLGGAVQIELAARTISPRGDGVGTIVEFVTVGRLRCTAAAALALRDALNQSLGMLQQPAAPQPTPAPAGKPVN